MRWDLYVRLKLGEWDLMPTSKVAQIAWYLLALDLLLFVLKKLLAAFKSSYGESLGGWVSFLTFVVAVLFFFLLFRYLKAKVLWRLRNRLIVTYVFIGVIPVVMLVTLALGSFYLFAGQFATFIVTSGLEAELKGVEASNSAIAHHFAAQLQRGAGNSAAALESRREADQTWVDRQVCVWLDKKLVLNSAPAGLKAEVPSLPGYLKDSFRDVVRDHGKLYLRATQRLPVNGASLTVLSSEPFDVHMLQELATNLGEVTLYATGISLRKVEQPQGKPAVRVNEETSSGLTTRKPEGEFVLDTGREALQPTFTAGAVPPATQSLDRQITLPTTVFVVDWDTGETTNPVAISVQTRMSKLYERLFGALGDFAPAAEFFILLVAIIFGIIELIALLIGVRLTRTTPGASARTEAAQSPAPR